MLTEQRKNTVNGLSNEELEIEVSRGRASRFQGELFDYAKAQLSIRKETKQDELSRRQLEVAKKTKTATHLGWIVAAGVGVALVVAQCAGIK